MSFETVAPSGSIDDFAVSFGDVDLRKYLWAHLRKLLDRGRFST